MNEATNPTPNKKKKSGKKGEKGGVKKSKESNVNDKATEGMKVDAQYRYCCAAMTWCVDLLRP